MSFKVSISHTVRRDAASILISVDSSRLWWIPLRQSESSRIRILSPGRARVLSYCMAPLPTTHSHMSRTWDEGTGITVCVVYCQRCLSNRCLFTTPSSHDCSGRSLFDCGT